MPIDDKMAIRMLNVLIAICLFYVPEKVEAKPWLAKTIEDIITPDEIETQLKCTRDQDCEKEDESCAMFTFIPGDKD